MPDEYTGLHTLAGFSDLQRAAVLSTKARIKTEGVVKTVQLQARIEKGDVDTLGGIISDQYEILDTVGGNIEIEALKFITLAGKVSLEKVDVLSTLAGIIENQYEVTIGFVAGKMFLEATRRSTLAGKTTLETAAIKRTLACKITLEEIVPPPAGVNNTLAGKITLSIWDIDSAKRIAMVLKFAHSVARAASYVDKGGNHITQVRQILGQYTGTTPWDTAGIAKLIVDVVKNDPGE